MIESLAPSHVTLEYPHPGGCDACRVLQVCNYCGTNIARDYGRCTNGRCTACHRDICTGHGNPHEHNFGKQGS